MEHSLEKVILGTRKGVIILENKKGKWEVINHSFKGIAVSFAFKHAQTGVIWAALDTDHWGPKLQKSLNDGETWEDVVLPSYPNGLEITKGVPATLGYIWSIYPGLPSNPNRLYLGTEPGGLFQSDDGGNTFHLVKSLWDVPSRSEWFGGGRDYPGLHSVVVDPTDENHLWAGISVGGVYESTDGGASWVPSNKGLIAEYLPNPDAEVGHDPHLLVVSPTNPQILYQQNHCGIFGSEDGGKNWQLISEENGPAHFGFAMAVDETNPKVAWVIPAISDEVRMAVNGAMCVSRTDDGGKTWQAFRDGLPQEHCYDFTFRHALDNRNGNLVFGTSTGNVFASQDNGETWETIGNYFPPVYSVRYMK